MQEIMTIFVLLLLLQDSTPVVVRGFDWQSIVQSIVVGGIMSLITYLVTRPKQQAEIRSENSTTRRTDAETVILSGDKLISWIEKFEAAKSEAIQMEIEMGAMKRALEDCVDYNGDCKEFLASIKDKLDSIFVSFQENLKHFADNDTIVKDLESMRQIVTVKLAKANLEAEKNLN